MSHRVRMDTVLYTWQYEVTQLLFDIAECNSRQADGVEDE